MYKWKYIGIKKLEHLLKVMLSLLNGEIKIKALA